MIMRFLQVVPVVAFGLSAFLAISGTACGEDINFAPEVDPGSMASALALLAGGGLLIVDRIRRRARQS